MTTCSISKGRAPALSSVRTIDWLYLAGMLSLSLTCFLQAVELANGKIASAWPGHNVGQAAWESGLLPVAVLLNVALVLLLRRYRQDTAAREAAFAAITARANMLAATDPLTHVLSRTAGRERGAAWLAAQETAGNPVAMLQVDLDRFRTINTLYGNAVGDLLLQDVAHRLVRLAPDDALVSRLGGDAFAVLLTFPDNVAASAELLANLFILALQGPCQIAGHDIRCAASVGIALINADQQDSSTSLDAESRLPVDRLDALVARAESAVRHAKRQGRNKAAVFTPKMQQAERAEAAIESGIRLGLERGEFLPFFEPQIDLATGQLLGHEMLMRWDRPGTGLVLPGEFIGVAEATDQIADMSWQVLREALMIARGWDAGLTLAINISPYQLTDPWLAQKMTKLLVETGFPPARLDIEITETALLDNLPLVRSTLTGFKNQGMTLSLDDFGTGYSSLSHLRALPFDQIKVDRSFVTGMTTAPDLAAKVEAIVRLAASLGMTVTAEGVEQPAEAAALHNMGCARAQGWHFGRPASAEDTRAGRWRQATSLPAFIRPLLLMRRMPRPAAAPDRWASRCWTSHGPGDRAQRWPIPSSRCTGWATTLS